MIAWSTLQVPAHAALARGRLGRSRSWLAGEVHPPEATAPARARRLGAALEHAEHRLGPQVLVEVDGLHDGDHSLFCIKLVENMGFGLDCGSPQLSGALWVVPIITRRPTAPEETRMSRISPPSAVDAGARRGRADARGVRPPARAPGKTDKIEFVSSSTSGGWKCDYYRNLAYPCSINGYQTFVIGTKVGSSDTAVAAALGPHARRRRGLLRRERRPAALGGQQVRGDRRDARSAS